MTYTAPEFNPPIADFHDLPRRPSAKLGYVDPLDDNRWRAEAAGAAVRAYGVGGYDSEEPATVVADLLADLRHLCDALGVDYDQLDARGQGHYLAEITGEDYPLLVGKVQP